jgi:hypothetical protein
MSEEEVKRGNLQKVANLPRITNKDEGGLSYNFTVK